MIPAEGKKEEKKKSALGRVSDVLLDKAGDVKARIKSAPIRRERRRKEREALKARRAENAKLLKQRAEVERRASIGNMTTDQARAKILEEHREKIRARVNDAMTKGKEAGKTRVRKEMGVYEGKASSNARTPAMSSADMKFNLREESRSVARKIKKKLNKKDDEEQK
jgi:hypothetical protein